MRRFHMWLGLSLGALLMLLGVTGAGLVFYPAIDAMLNPKLKVEGRHGPDFDQAMVTLRQIYPEKQGPWRLEVTGEPGPIPARYYNPPERAEHAFRPMMVWLSPDGLLVLRRDYWGEYAMTFVYDLHYRLLLGESGGTILGWSGFGLLVLLLGGLWTWWPRGSWRKALRWKGSGHCLRAMRDWHKLVGLASLVPLLLLTVTGMMLALPRHSDALLRAMGLVVERSPAGHPVAPSGLIRNNPPDVRGGVIAPSAAIARAQALLPDARLAWIETPAVNGGLYRLRLQVPGDPGDRFPHSFVYIDAVTGAVHGLVDARKARAGTTINNWIHALHNGVAGGMTGRILTLLAGLAPLVLFVTGLQRWRGRKRPGRKPASISTRY